jgi:hypothetical protein
MPPAHTGEATCQNVRQRIRQTVRCQHMAPSNWTWGRIITKAPIGRTHAWPTGVPSANAPHSPKMQTEGQPRKAIQSKLRTLLRWQNHSFERRHYTSATQNHFLVAHPSCAHNVVARPVIIVRRLW